MSLWTMSQNVLVWNTSNEAHFSAHMLLCNGLQGGEGCRLPSALSASLRFHAPGSRTPRPCRIVHALGEQLAISRLAGKELVELFRQQQGWRNILEFVARMERWGEAAITLCDWFELPTQEKPARPARDAGDKPLTRDAPPCCKLQRPLIRPFCRPHFQHCRHFPSVDTGHDTGHSSGH